VVWHKCNRRAVLQRMGSVEWVVGVGGEGEGGVCRCGVWGGRGQRAKKCREGMLQCRGMLCVARRHGASGVSNPG